mgnify:FL=1|jgi:uncharacterized membrane protein
MSDKKHIIIRAVVVVVCLAAFIIAADRLRVTDKEPIVTTLGYSYENAKVIEVVEDNLSPDGVRVGYQMLKVQLTSGEYKGEIVNATSAEDNLFGAVCKKGDSVVVHMSVSGDSKNVSVYSKDRIVAVAAFVGIFLLLICVIGGKNGVKSVIGLVFTFVAIFMIYIPLIYRGFSPFWAAVIITIITTIVTMYLISGIAVKTLCAILGTVIGVLLAGLSAWLFGRVADIDGYNVSNIETLAYVGQITNIQIGGLLFSGILIASLGAVMDVAMSVSSAISEIHDKAPQLGCLELFKSGMNVGRDMMGTMSNTLILAFVGSAVSELVINYAYNLPFRQIINSYNIGIEIMQGVSGSIGVILTVPAVAVVTAWMLTRGEHAKNEGNVAE